MSLLAKAAIRPYAVGDRVIEYVTTMQADGAAKVARTWISEIVAADGDDAMTETGGLYDRWHGGRVDRTLPYAAIHEMKYSHAARAAASAGGQDRGGDA